jgi:hypothetical protein
VGTLLGAAVGVLVTVVPQADGGETTEALRQGLIEVAEVADIIGGGDGSSAVAARAALEELQPESLEAIQAELEKQTGWQGTDALLTSLLPLAESRASDTSGACSLPLSCPDTAPSCDVAKKVSVTVHYNLWSVLFNAASVNGGLEGLDMHMRAGS